MTTPRLVITTSLLGSETELLERCRISWSNTQGTLGANEWCIRWNTLEDNLGVTGSLQWLYEHTTAPVIAFLHSDCEIFEPGWDVRVLREFDDPGVGVVGFGGALQLGEDDIYKTPYRLTQLRRIDYRSNTRDSEQHGAPFIGSCDVATLDGFALIVRRELLHNWHHQGNGAIFSKEEPWTAPENIWSGWPVERYPFHNYDNALCIYAHRTGWRVRLVGIDCIHHGGATATTPAYQEWSHKTLGKSDAEVHTDSHIALYEDGRGVLPWRVK